MSDRKFASLRNGLAVLSALVAVTAGAVTPLEIPESWTFRGVMEFAPLPKDVDAYCAHVTNVLGRIGVRQLVLRVGYSYAFASHPECRTADALSREQLGRIRSACRAVGIELIPKMNLFGHQHTKEQGRGSILSSHPEFSETRGKPDPSREDGSICAKSEAARTVVVDLMAEVAEVCGAREVHVGCDEVADLGVCERCKGTPRDRLYADWVNGVSRALKAKGLGVMIWGDMMLDTRDYWRDDMDEKSYDMRSQETVPSADLVDRDITVCDWQYYVKREYRSFDRFASRGFKSIVSPWCWGGTEAAENVIAFAKKHDKGQIRGFLLTSWDEEAFVRASYEGRPLEGDDYNERLRSRSCDYQRFLQLFFPKAAEAVHGGWTWWNAAEAPLDPIEGKAFEPRGKVHRFYDRLPVAHSNEIPKDVWDLQKNTAGEVLRFTTGSDKLRLRWKPRSRELGMFHMCSIGMSGLDVYQFEDGVWKYRKPPFPYFIRRGTNDFTFDVAPNEPTLVYLPLYNGVESLVVGVRSPHDLKPLGPHASGVTKPVVVYGTSTTQGGCVSRPGMCWTSIAGRVADVPVVNLGFSGSGKMEDVLCTCLIEADASLYVLDTVGNMDVALMKERFEKFVRRLHAAKPDVPIAISLNVWPVAVEGSGAVRCGTCDYADRNTFLRGLFKKLKDEDPKLWKDLHLLGDDAKAIAPDDEGTVDGVHLNDLGSQRFGTYMGARFREILKAKPIWPPPHGHVCRHAVTDPIRRQNAHLPDSGKGAPVFSFGRDGTFTVMQMTDTHWSRTTMRDRERRFYAEVAKRFRPDLAVLTGDNVNLRWKGPTGFDAAAKALLSLLVDNGIPFALTLGNHDCENTGPDYYTGPEQWEVYRALGGKLFVDFNVSKLGGVGSGVIHLQQDGRTKFDVYLLDSGDYDPFNATDAWGEYDGYDGVRRDQIEWVREQLKAGVPSLFFQHIPVCEIEDSFDGGRTQGRGIFMRVPPESPTGHTGCRAAPIAGSLYAVDPVRATGVLGEVPCPQGSKSRRTPRYLTADGKSLYEVWKESGCVKGAYFGHDHRNSYDGVNDDGMRLGASPASSFHLAQGNGVRIFTIRADGTYETQVVTEESLALARGKGK